MFFFFIIIDFFFFVSWIFYGNILAEFDKFLAPEFAKKKTFFQKSKSNFSAKNGSSIVDIVGFHLLKL